ncbi:19431_t:CDS:1, partial [Gigaspora rosea]
MPNRPISDDNRKRDWFFTSIKENSSKEIYRVSKKSKERLVAEHWQIEDQDNYIEHLKLQSCKDCTLSTSLDVNSCYRHFNKKESL